MTTAAHLQAVTSFVANVGNATGFPSNVDPTEAVGTRAVMLAEKHPDTRMFCDASATFVAMECGMMNLPSVAIIGRLLEKWWDKNKPALKALAGPVDIAPIPNKDRIMVANWMQWRDNGRSAQDSIVGLSVLRRYANAGYRWLIQNDNEAAGIAVVQRWTESNPHPQAPSEDDKAEVARTVHGTGEAVKADAAWPRTTHGQQLPQNLGTLADGRKLGALTPEQLHEQRMNNRVLRPFAQAEAQKAAAKVLAEESASVMQVAAASTPGRSRRAKMPYDEDVEAGA